MLRPAVDVGYLTYSCKRDEHDRCSNPRNDMFAPRCSCPCHVLDPTLVEQVTPNGQG